MLPWRARYSQASLLATQHSTVQYTVYSIQYTVHSIQYTVHSTQYTVRYSRAGYSAVWHPLASQGKADSQFNYAMMQFYGRLAVAFSMA